MSAWMKASMSVLSATALSLSAAGLYGSSARAALPEGSVTVTVESGARQSFVGFGASLIPDAAYGGLSQERRTELARLLWHDLNFRILRLWADPTQGIGGQRTYIVDGMVRDALNNGATTILLAPTGRGAQDAAAYTHSIAQIISEYRRRGFDIQFTGVANEPGDGAAAAVTSSGQMIDLVKSLRAALDAQNLSAVKIIAPELANADRRAADWLDALKASDAWRSLYGFSTHSYNMAATDEISARLQGTGREYWITEASDNGPEEAENASNAASLAARVLNDVNHLANAWIFFIGYCAADPKDNATRIIAYAPREDGSDWTTLFLKYYYFKQLSRAFDVGARFRRSTSSLEGSMVWTYGRKPRVTAAAAQNPDGSWAVGVVDYTSDAFLSGNDWNRTQRGQAAQPFRVTIDLQELHGSGQCSFALYRSNAGRHDIREGTVTAKDGVMTVRVDPLDLVTLRSGSCAAAPHSGAPARR